ncbi:MAG: FAD/NAD(P)-binding protein [Panacagrimonas sp.]
MVSESVWDVAVVGGGYAGAVAAIETLRLSRRPLRLCVIESRPALGRGIAYSTTASEHRLNTRAKRMSLVAGDENHFTRWARQYAQHVAWPDDIDEDSFVPRAWFGTYVEETLAFEVHRTGSVFEHRRAVALDLTTELTGWAVHLSGWNAVVARHVVLAIGNLPRRQAALPGLDSRDTRVLHAWDAARAEVPAGATALIIGTGLTMVDALLSLRVQGHAGVVHAVSRHGAMPQAHSDHHGRAQPLLSRSLRVAARELRLGCELDKRSGRPWQWRIDANRHHAQAFWIGLSSAEKRRFLRHGRSFWDVHRHRISESIRQQLDAELEAGTLKIHAGRVGIIEPSADALRVILKHRGGQETELRVGLLLNSLGFELDYRRTDAPLVQGLLRSGIVRPGELGLGLDTDAFGRLRATDGRPWPNLYTLGTARIGQLWETTAAHEIRLQAAELAGALVRGLLG